MENVQEAIEKDQTHPSHSPIRSQNSEQVIAYRDMYTSYRHLLHNLSMQLTQDNLKSIVYLRMVPESVSNHGQLAVLKYLDQRGEIAWNSTDSLHALLKDINRIDLAHSHLRQYEITLERYISQEKRKDRKFSQGHSGHSEFAAMGSRTMSDSIINKYHCAPSFSVSHQHTPTFKRHKSERFERHFFLEEHPVVTGLSPEHCMALLNLSDSKLGQLKRKELMKCVSEAGYNPSNYSQENRTWMLRANSSSESFGLSDSGVADDWLEISSEEVWQTDSDESTQFVAQCEKHEQNEGQQASFVSNATSRTKSRCIGLFKCHHRRKVFWGMCVRDLLPVSRRRSKVISKSLRVRCVTVPDIRLQLTIQPWGIESEGKSGEPTHTALEVTVIKPQYPYHCAQLHLELDIIKHTGKKLVRHSDNHPLQSFFIPQLVSHESLRQLPSSGKLSIHILSYVIPDREVNESLFEIVDKNDCTVDCTSTH